MWVTAYALCQDRTASVAERFLDTFAPSRASASADFPFPQYADTPEHVYTNATSLIRRLEGDHVHSYSLYWKGTADGTHPVSQAMLFYTDDAQMIAGLVVEERDAIVMLSKLVAVTGAKWGVITGDEPPPTSSTDFVRMCEAATSPRVLDGSLVHAS